ncbi:MAG: VOC family protein [Clostridia bacterium]|nr:VOC family protein [Clostridia bacterium]
MKIEHVAMYVNDLEAARQFFVRYLGAVSGDGYVNTRTGFRSYFLTFEDGARLEIMNKPGVASQNSSNEHLGYAHIAFSLGSREQVDALTNQMASDGYAVVSGPRVTGDGYYESCIACIEGNRIELTV